MGAWYGILTFVLIYISTYHCKQNDKDVSLKVQSIGCKPLCRQWHAIPCQSSVELDGKQVSSQQEGLNVVVIDITTKKTTNRSFSDIGNDFDDLINFIQQIKPGFIVVITSDNMCSPYERWFLDLKKSTSELFQESHIDGRNGAYLALGVWCKGACSIDVKNGRIPYQYFGFEEKHQVDFVFRHTGSRNSSTKPLLSTTAAPTKSSDRSSSLVIVSSLVVVIFVVVTIAVFIILRKKKQQKKSSCDNNKEKNDITNKEVSGKMVHNPTYGRQENIISIVPPNLITPKKKLPSCSEDNCFCSENNGSEKEQKPTPYEHILLPKTACFNKKKSIERTRQESIQYEQISNEPIDNVYIYVEPPKYQLKRKTCQLKRSLTDASDTYKLLPPPNTQLSLSLGSSYEVFKRSSEYLNNRNDEERKFASYVKINTSEVVYKNPSSVPKFAPPTTRPKDVQTGEYMNMTPPEYECASSPYQRLQDREVDVYEMI